MRPHSNIFLKFAALTALLLGAVGAYAAQIEVPGKVRVDVYNDMAGTLITDLINSDAYKANSPSEVYFPPIAEYPFDEADPTQTPVNLKDNYAVKISGFLTAPSAGDWVFWISSDDQSALYLSSDADPAKAVEVAREPNWARQRYYFFTRDATTVYPEGDAVNHGGEGLGCTVGADGYVKCANNTVPIHLAAGEKRAFYILGKEGGGDDDWSVWATTDKNPYENLQTKFPGYPEAASRPVPLMGTWISTMASDTAEIRTQPANTTALVGRTFVFSAAIEPAINSGVFAFQWFKNGVAIPDATGALYNSATADPNGPILAVLSMNGDKYKFEATPATGAKLTSTEATLTVTDDNVPPTISKVVTYETGNALRLEFDESMDATAFQAGSYSFSGGITVSEVQQRDNKAVILTSKQAEDTEYTLTMTAGVKDVAGNAVANKTVTFRSWKVQKGKVGFRAYDGALDTSDTIAKADANEAAYFGEGLDQALSPVNVLNDTGADFSYGGVLQMLFSPPQTGDYVFWFSSDDIGQLYLSTDATQANRKLIAAEPVWNNSGDWVAPADGANLQRNRPDCGTTDTGPMPDCPNRSDQYLDTEWATKDANGKAKITLTQGQKYYVEAIWREGGGGDNGGVTFTMAGAAAPASAQTALKGDVVEWLAPVSNVAPTPTISVARTATGASVTYSGNLYSADVVTGPYAIVTGATSPYTVDTTGAARKYYRAGQ